MAFDTNVSRRAVREGAGIDNGLPLRLAETEGGLMYRFVRALARGLVFAVLFGSVSSAALAEMVLNKGNGDDPKTFDPQRIGVLAEAAVTADLFEGLMAYGADGTPVPGMAESWTVADDGLTYIFRLRADGKWSDGTPVTAADVVFGWQRLVDPETASPYATYLDGVVNARDIRTGAKPPTDLGAQAIDAITLKVRLVAPAPYFVTSLTHPATSAVSRASVKRFGADAFKPGNLVSNGAYMLAEAAPRDHVKLTRNPHFHDAASIRIDTVMIYPTEDADAELRRFRAGGLDVTYDLPGQQVEALRQANPGQIHITPYLGTYYYAYNLTHEPWRSSRELREALSLAIDRDLLVTRVTRGRELPAYSFVPRGTLNFPSWQPDAARLTQAQRDAKAKELFAKAGYGPDRPLKLELFYNVSENHERMARAIAEMWQKKLGVVVEFRTQEWGPFRATFDGRRFSDIARNGWVGDYNDAYSFLQLGTGGSPPLNGTGYANPKYRSLIARTATETDPARRGQLLQQAERIMIDDLPIIPIYHYASRHAVSPAVKGWVDNVQDFHLVRWLSIER
ncbi:MULTISPECIES: peptide ABC transporter substrate-binding protein [unclassified Inquilinus]|uniref:peptide ABC transporter substrate-binding protein n=1 Tax=unclassified Inquilinus TaxID=2645927 RepID=UPI003F92A4C4